MIISQTKNSITINKSTLTASAKQYVADFISELLLPKENDPIYDKITRIYDINQLEKMLFYTPQNIFTITIEFDENNHPTLYKSF